MHAKCDYKASRKEHSLLSGKIIGREFREEQKFGVYTTEVRLQTYCRTYSVGIKNWRDEWRRIYSFYRNNADAHETQPVVM